MKLIEICQKKWEYTLYKSDNGYILSVVCGGVGLYELNIPISKEEAEQALKSESYLEDLAEKIRRHPQQYSDKSVKI